MYFSGISPIRMIKSDFDMFIKFFLSAATRMAFFKITKKKLRSPIYAGHIVINQNRGNELLKELIISKEPFMFGRHGSNELLIAGYGLLREKGIIDSIPIKNLETASAQCGFFPCNEETIKRFTQKIIEASNECTVYGTFRMLWEDYFIKHFMQKQVLLTHLNMMDFWRYEVPFTSALKGKKVLVVHPLANQIKEQYYYKREHIFVNKQWLPEFELQTLTAVQTIAGIHDSRFSDWFEALEYMKLEVERMDFDIALLACGAYGMPLTAHIKKIGKQAIYMGGVLQILFGIRGKRWDNIPEIAALYNKYWVSPDEAYIPKKADIVEGGCYW